MSHSADLGSVGGLHVARPEAIVDGLSIADRLVAVIGFFGATPQTVNPANGSPYLPGPGCGVARATTPWPAAPERTC